MLGLGRPSTVRAKTSPMMANSTKLRSSHWILAPRSSITHSDSSVGRTVAIAGRVIPGNVLRASFAMAIKAPVLPAETKPAASPRLTASMASPMEEPRPLRRAADGLSSPLITISVWWMLDTARSFS